MSGRSNLVLAGRSIERYERDKVIDAWTRVLVEDRRHDEWT